MEHLSRWIRNKPAIRSVILYPLVDLVLQFPVKFDGVKRVGSQIIITLNAIWYAGITEDRFRKQRCKFARMYLRTDLHQFLQIDDLMVAPIADVGPRIIRFRKLPIDTFTR